MKKPLSLVLAALMLLASLTSCSESGTNAETSASDGSTQTSAENIEVVEEEEEEYTLETARQKYSDRDYGGYSFRIADRDTGDWLTFDVYAEELTGEAVNDAVYERNVALEDTMNITIVECRYDSVCGTVKTSITAGVDDYDVFTDGVSDICAIVSGNYILDWNTVETIDPTNTWWDQQLYSDLSIMGKSYVMTGDISVMDNYGTWCYLFNKDLIEDFNLENPYDLVDTGKWTLDKHNEMASAATLDMDGDGSWTMEDCYGYVTETYNNMAMWSCFGFRIVNKDADDVPYYTYDGESEISALMKVIDCEYSEFTNMGTGSTVTGGGSFTANTRENQFAIGKALFYYAGMRNITLYREVDTNFGVIPAPKLDESQSQYWSSYSPGNFTAYALPTTISDTNKVGDIIEAMAEFSVYTLTPAYYDKTLIGKSTRDVESEPMIELILNTRNFDLGIFYDWGGIRSAFCNITSSDTVASKFKTLAKVATKTLDKFMEKLNNGEE